MCSAFRHERQKLYRHEDEEPGGWGMGWSVSAVDMASRQIGQEVVVVDDMMMMSLPLHSSSTSLRLIHDGFVGNIIAEGVLRDYCTALLWGIGSRLCCCRRVLLLGWC